MQLVQWYVLWPVKSGSAVQCSSTECLLMCV